jgi:uncharacterized protein (TIGR02118 family)
MTDVPVSPGPADDAGTVRLFAFVRRREGTTTEQFLDHWRNHHGPLIRDTPGLGDRVVRYEQHAARPDDRSGWDGVAVQEFESWDDFIGMPSDPAGAAMRADEEAFLDPASIKVVFTHDRVVVIGDDAASDASSASASAPSPEVHGG